MSLSVVNTVRPIISTCLQKFFRVGWTNSFSVFRVEGVPLAIRGEVMLNIASNSEFSSYTATAGVSIDELVAHNVNFGRNPCRVFVFDLFAFLPKYVMFVCWDWRLEKSLMYR